jgi:hypothetical protein
VLGADVVVPEAQRFAQRELEYLLRAWGERDLAGGDVLAGADDPNHSFAHAFNRDLKRLKDARGYALFFAQQPKQDVLGADVVVVQCPRLFLGQDDHLARAFGKSLKHTRRIARLSAAGTADSGGYRNSSGPISSIGFLKPRRFRGRSLSSVATQSRSMAL